MVRLGEVKQLLQRERVADDLEKAAAQSPTGRGDKQLRNELLAVVAQMPTLSDDEAYNLPLETTIARAAKSVQGVHEALLAQTAKEVAQHLDTLKIEALTGRGLAQVREALNKLDQRCKNELEILPPEEDLSKNLDKQ